MWSGHDIVTDCQFDSYVSHKLVYRSIFLLKSFIYFVLLSDFLHWGTIFNGFFHCRCVRFCLGWINWYSFWIHCFPILLHFNQCRYSLLYMIITMDEWSFGVLVKHNTGDPKRVSIACYCVYMCNFSWKLTILLYIVSYHLTIGYMMKGKKFTKC